MGNINVEEQMLIQLAVAKWSGPLGRMIIYYILNAKLVINKSMVLICRDCYRPMWRSL